jgi:hypothetical protein
MPHWSKRCEPAEYQPNVDFEHGTVLNLCSTEISPVGIA